MTHDTIEALLTMPPITVSQEFGVGWYIQSHTVSQIYPYGLVNSLDPVLTLANKDHVSIHILADCTFRLSVGEGVCVMLVPSYMHTVFCARQYFSAWFA